MSPDLFFQVVVPLLGVKNTALLAISTPQDEFNYYTELMNLKDQWGESLFYTIKLGLICAACSKSGAACNHKLSMNPHWKPPERTGKVDAVMACNPALRDRETRGDVKSTKRFLLQEGQIESLRARATHEFADSKPGVLYSAIDPSGGGAGSDYAIVTVAFHGPSVVVVGIDKSASADPIEIERMINRHYESIRKHARYSQVHIRVFIEANMSFIDAGRVANQLKHSLYGSLEVVSEDKTPARRLGIWTSKDSKEAYAIEIQRAVPHMSFADQFISQNAAECQTELMKQLSVFRREIIAPVNDVGVALCYKVALTGKSSGRKDDLVMALGIAIYYMYRSQNDILFTDFCMRTGRSST